MDMLLPSIDVKRSEQGREIADAIVKMFSEQGLLVRSVQLKNCQCVTSPPNGFDPAVRRVPDRAYIDGFSYAHPSIVQTFFQLSPVGNPLEMGEGKRAMGLLFDWTQNVDRFVDFSTSDMSANKTATNITLKTEEECHSAIRELRNLGDGKEHGHNEIRFYNTARASLIGLLWCPIERPTPLSDGGADWDISSKPKFVKKVAEIKLAGGARHGLPVFTYQKGAQMSLQYLDYIE